MPSSSVRADSRIRSFLFAGLLLAALAIFGTVSSAWAAPEEIQGRLGAGPDPLSTKSPQATSVQEEIEASRIPGHYIVVLKDSVKHPGAVAEAQTEGRGGELGLVYRSALKGYSASDLSKSDVESLREDPRVKFVEPDRKVKAMAQTIPTGVKRIGAAANPALDIDETDDVRVDADVAVIDTGIDYTHPDLNVVSRTNCVPANEDPAGEEWYVKACVDNTGVDGRGHGTHVAGTIGALDNGIGVVGVAPGARLWAVRVLNNQGFGSGSWIIAGIDWVTAHAAQIEVANMSLGGPGSSFAEEVAIEASVEAGVVYVVAAGNEGDNASAYAPANDPSVITVSALADSDGVAGGKGAGCYGADDTLASFSNWGADVEIAAPGTCIYSTLPLGGSYYGANYGTVSGTSMASPHVAGAAAVLAAKSNPNSKKDVETIRQTLIDEASLEWEDNSGDRSFEPLLYLGAEPLKAAEVGTGGWSSNATAGTTISGAINPRGQKAEYRFEYGPTPSYGSSAPASPGIKEGNYATLTQQLSGLSRSTTYHYRLSATTASGTVYGKDRSFTLTDWTIRPQDEPTRTGASWLNDVECTDHESCIAVGHYYAKGIGNRALAYVGSGSHWSWQAPPSDPLNDLEGVSCSSATACTAVGSGSAGSHVIPVAARWNGSTWSLQEVPVPAESTYAELADVSCPSSTECVAVGDYKNSAGVFVDYSARWSGGAWSTLSTPNPAASYSQTVLESVSCPSAGWCKAVGWYNPSNGEASQKVVMAWNGTSWSLQAAAVSKGFLAGVECISTEFCLAAGGWLPGGPWATALERWNGSSWSFVTTPTLSEASGGYLETLSCVSTTECTAVGGAFSEINGKAYTLVEDWNGSAWTVSKTPRESERARSELYGVACLGSRRCSAVGYSKADKIGDPILETRPAIATYESSFGSKGTGNGQVESPWGLDADGQGNVWVADRSNNRIEKFNEKGEYVTKFGTKGSGNGQLSEPLDVAFDSSGNLWVTDSGNHRVQEFNSKGEYLSQFGSEGTGYGEFVEPWSIDVAPDGNIWVTDARYYRVEEFTPKGEFIRTVGGFEGPRGLEVDSSGHVWVTDSGNQVWELSATGEKLQHFGEKGTGDGQLDGPQAVAITPSGEVLVADRFNGRVAQFAPDGEFEAQIGTMGSGTAQMQEPRGIAAGEGGSIYVSDTWNNRLQRWFEAGPPSTTTKAATELTSTSARLTASVNPVGAPTTYHFEYDTTKYQEGEGPHGTTVPVPDESIGSGRNTLEVTKQISELQPNTIYHFRVVANNQEGTAYGNDAIFITPAMVHPHWATCTYQSGGGSRFASSKCSTEGSPNEWESVHLKAGEKATITAKGNLIAFSAVVSGIATTFSCETEVVAASLENPTGGGSGVGNAEVKYKGCKAEGLVAEKGCKVENTANYPSKLELTVVEGKTEAVLVPKEGTTFATFSFSGCAGSKALEELNGAWSLTGIAYALYSNTASQLEFNSSTGNLLKLRSQTASATGSIKLETTTGGYVRGQVEPHWAACTKQSGGRYASGKCDTEGSPNEWEALLLKAGEKSTVAAKGNPIAFAAVVSGIGTAFSCETEVSGASLENPAGGDSGLGNAEIKYKGCKAEGVVGQKGCKVENTANYPSKLELAIVEGKTEVILKPKEGTTFATFNFSGCAGSKALESLNGSWSLTGIGYALYSNAASQLEFSAATGGQLKLRNQPASATGSIKLESSAGGYIAASNGDLAVLASQLHWSACIKQSSGKYSSGTCSTEGKPKEWESALLKAGEETTITAEGNPIALAAVVSGISTTFSCETEVAGATLENPVGGGKGLGNAEIKYKGCKTEGFVAEKGCKVENTANYPSKLELTVVEGKTEAVLVPKEGTTFATFSFSGCAGSKVLESLNGSWKLTGTAYALYSNTASQLEFNATTGNQLKLKNWTATATGSIVLETTGGGYISALSTYVSDLPRNHWSACAKQSGGRYASGTCRAEGSPYEWEALLLKAGEKTTIAGKGNPIAFSAVVSGIATTFSCETEVVAASLENPSGGGNGIGNAEVKYKGCKAEGVVGEKGCKVENTANYPSKLELAIVEAKTEVVLKPSSGETFAGFSFSGCTGSKALEALNGSWSLTGTAYALYSNPASQLQFNAATGNQLKLRNQPASATGSIKLETTAGGYLRTE